MTANLGPFISRQTCSFKHCFLASCHKAPPSGYMFLHLGFQLRGCIKDGFLLQSLHPLVICYRKSPFRMGNITMSITIFPKQSVTIQYKLPMKVPSLGFLCFIDVQMGVSQNWITKVAGEVRTSLLKYVELCRHVDGSHDGAGLEILCNETVHDCSKTVD